MDFNELHDDDKPVGRVLTRREVLALLGAAGASLFSMPLVGRLAAQQATPTPGTVSTVPACVVRPEQTEGPYFLDARLNRSDIRVDPVTGQVKQGVPLKLVFRVSQIGSNTCTPYEGVMVDIWHCDAHGVYSGFEDANGFFDTTDEAFLRGYQITNTDGIAEFTTIYPGWYPGRTVHIHFKLRTDPESQRGTEFTSQLYFDDALTDLVLQQEPYAEKGQRDRRNEQDGLYRNGGDLLTLELTEATADELATPYALNAEATPEATVTATAEPDGEGGYIAFFDIGLQSAAG